MDRILGMQCLAKALIDIGRQINTTQEVDVADLPPCEYTSPKSISEVGSLQQEKMKPLVQKLRDTGEAVASDG